MTPEQFVKRIEEVVTEQGGDEESEHNRMDYLCWELLETLGYSKGITRIRDLKKDWWWA